MSVANLNVGIQVSAASSTTVVGTTAYSGNTINTSATVDNLTNNTHPMYLTASDPLFVDAAAGNFYPAEGSPLSTVRWILSPTAPA